MSKDIRAFFKVVSTKKDDENLTHKVSTPKRKAKQLQASDDEHEVFERKSHKKKRRIIDSDDEDDRKKKIKDTPDKKSSPAKEKKAKVEVDISNLFGEPGKTTKRVKTEKPPAIISSEVIDLIDDSALEHDMSLLVDELDKSEMSPKVAETKTEKVKKEPSVAPKSAEKRKLDKSPAKPISQGEPKAVVEVDLIASPTNKKQKVQKPSSSAKKEKKVKEPKESSAEDDQARHERKQASIAMYHKFKNRASVINPGSKEIPKGKPDCLKGLQFVISGVLESMERDEAADLIKSCGGNCVTGMSKKVTHLILGDEPGMSKQAKAEELGIPQITEDDLLNLIREKSGLAVPSKAEVKVEILVSSPGKENRKNNVLSPEKLPAKSLIKVKDDDTKSSAPQQNVTASPVEAPNLDHFSFVDKYKPTSIKNIIGQQGANGNAQKLMNWLSRWHINHDGKKKHAKPNPWAKNNDGSAYKAALLSGSPGVGKTTTAHLVCKELMFDIVEFNASDTRSKKLLKEEVSSLLSNTSLNGYLAGSETKVSKRHVLIMDEVDGMAGNEDRGGVAELIALIKDSHVPVICMCNDRNHPKIRSLANHCFDLRFNKPTLNMIRGAMMSVCFKEGIKIEAGAVDEIISGTNNDIRQTLNHLALYSASKGAKLTITDAKKNAQMSEKDIKIGPFEVIRKVFSAEDHKTMTFNDKSDLFFHDYNMASLFVQENYLKVKPACEKSELMRRVAMAADSLSLGDLVERKIRSSQAWSLLPTQAIFSSVLPGEYMEGSFSSATNFPGWLGKNSRSNKRKRLAQEIHEHTRMSTSGSRLSVRLDYAPFLVKAIVTPLVEKGLEGVSEALNVVKEYRLLREDIDALLELTTWPKGKNLWDSVESKVKAALTRAYNKEIQPYTYSVQAGVKKKAAKSAENEDLVEYEQEEEGQPLSDEEEDDSLENNALIKVKKPTASKENKAGTSKASGSSSKAGTSKSSSKPKSNKK